MPLQPYTWITLPRSAAQEASTSPPPLLPAALLLFACGRLPGLGIIYTQATSGLPAVLQHMLVNMPVLHQVVVLLTVRVIPRPYASEDERFLVRRSNTLEGTYRVIVRWAGAGQHSTAQRVGRAAESA